MNYEDLLEHVKKRRSIRRFKPDSIPDEAIEKIIEVARWAPSGFNMQPWEFVVVKKPDLRQKIAEYLGDYWRNVPDMESAREDWQGRPWKATGVVDAGSDFSVAPVYIIVFGDTRTKAGLPMGVRFAPDRYQTIVISGLAHAFVYMTLAAASLGLASQWNSAITTPYAHCMTKKLLGIPEALEAYDMMALGYPNIKPSGKYMRDLHDMIHYDDCGADDFRSDAEVRDFVKRARNWTIGTHSRK